jgi:ABC-type multidrug transport system fused ATPase/permease subunit
MSGTLGARLLTIAPASRSWLAGLVVVLLGMTATYVGQGLLVARALSRVFAGDGLASLAVPALGVLLLQLARAGLSVLRAGLATRAAAEVKQAVRQALVARLLALGPGWRQRTRTGTLQAVLVDGVEALEAYVGRFLPQLVAAVLGAAGVTAYLIVLDPLAGGVVLACALATALVPIASKRLFQIRMRDWIRAYRGLYAENLDAIQGMATLKAFNASRRRGEQLRRQAVAFCRDSVRLTAPVVAYVGVVGLLVGGGTAAAVGVGALRLAAGELSMLGLLIVLLLTREAFRPLHDLEKAYHASYGARPAGESIIEVLETQPTLTAPAARAPVEAATLRFEEVRFRYDPLRRPALDGFTLSVAAGERVALVGRSGAGKTTVVSLLLRFFDPDQGRILVGDKDIRDVPLDQLRELVAVVAQDTYLFHGTVRHNLQLARPEATGPELVAAARAAQAHEFISALPDGYDTVVGERGLRLSGGQRQRIAIARALLKNAPILVLDEPTSSVDAANEAAIQEALDGLTRDRTTLVIAHRLSTVRSADRIVVLDAGQVLEAGEHSELVDRGGAYAELVSAQGGTR